MYSCTLTYISSNKNILAYIPSNKNKKFQETKAQSIISHNEYNIIKHINYGKYLYKDILSAEFDPHWENKQNFTTILPGFHIQNK